MQGPSPQRVLRLTLNSLLFLVLSVLLIALGLVVLAQWYAPPNNFTITMGPSMRPNLDYFHLVSLRPATSFRRQSIVYYISVLAGGAKMMHRIIGLPGETIEVRGGEIIIGKGGERFTLEEPYVKLQFQWDWPATALGEEEYLILGDNRQIEPARTPELVRGEHILAVATAIAFPPWGARSLE